MTSSEEMAETIKNPEEQKSLSSEFATITEAASKADKECELLPEDTKNKEVEYGNEIKSLKAQLENMRTKSKVQETEIATLTSLLKQESKEHMGLIENFISLRDSLELKLSWIGDHHPDDTNSIKLVSNLLKQTASILGKDNVSILEDTGKFDSSIHTAQGVEQTDDPTLIDQIARTFRPGYKHKDEYIRAQEVIVYAKIEE